MEALRPLRERNFRLLVSASTIDSVGNAMAPIALSFAVLDRTGSVTDLGIVVGARSIANVLLLLVGGVLADRFPRAVIMQGAMLLAGASQAVATASVFGHFDSIVLLAALGVINGAASAVAIPASLALTPQTVPSQLMRSANALQRIGQSGAGMVGASIGGVLVGLTSPAWALAIDTASFFAVAVLFARMRLPGVRVIGGRTSTLHELRVGWRTFVTHTWVWVIVAQFLVINAVVVGGVQVLGPDIAEHTIGRTQWGLVLAAQTLGSVLGGILAAHWQPRRALRLGVLACFVEALPLLALGRLPEFQVLAPVMFACGFCMAQFGVAWAVSLQQRIPPDRLARVYSYDAVGSFVAIPLGQLAIGPLAVVLGDRSTLDIAAVLVVIVTAAAFAVPSVRNTTVHAAQDDTSDRRSRRAPSR